MKNNDFANAYGLWEILALGTCECEQAHNYLCKQSHGAEGQSDTTA